MNRIALISLCAACTLDGQAEARDNTMSDDGKDLTAILLAFNPSNAFNSGAVSHGRALLNKRSATVMGERPMGPPEPGFGPDRAQYAVGGGTVEGGAVWTKGFEDEVRQLKEFGDDDETPKVSILGRYGRKDPVFGKQFDPDGRVDPESFGAKFFSKLLTDKKLREKGAEARTAATEAASKSQLGRNPLLFYEEKDERASAQRTKLSMPRFYRNRNLQAPSKWTYNTYGANDGRTQIGDGGLIALQGGTPDATWPYGTPLDPRKENDPLKGGKWRWRGGFLREMR